MADDEIKQPTEEDVPSETMVKSEDVRSEPTPTAHDLAEQKASEEPIQEAPKEDQTTAQLEKKKEVKQTSQPKAHVAKWKKEMVSQIQQDLPKYKTVAVINMKGLPSAQLQKIRSKIKDKAKIIMTRRRLIRRAVEGTPYERLSENLEGMCALLLSNEDSFELFRILKENMSPAPAKTGQEAPMDIVIPAGPTPFAPGPVLGELGMVGIKAGIEGGKIVVKQDSTVIKAGETISAPLASVLARLDIKPVKVGMNLIMTLEGGKVYLRDVLNVDVDEFTARLKEAAQNAFKLSIGADIITKESAEYLLREAHMNAQKLATGTDIMTDDNKENLIKKAGAQAKNLKTAMPDVPVEDTKTSQPTEEAEKEEEKPEETIDEAITEDSEGEKEELKTLFAEPQVETPEESPVEEPAQTDS